MYDEAHPNQILFRGDSTPHKIKQLIRLCSILQTKAIRCR
jgi:hypothetical protein